MCDAGVRTLGVNPSMQLVATGGDWPCVVLDAALEDPEGLVELAARHRGAFAPTRVNAFPGPELPLPRSAVQGLAQRFTPQFAERLGVAGCLDGHGRLSIVTLAPAQLAPLQRVCHRDRLALRPGERVIAAVIYLFTDARLGGTSFFRPRGTPEDTERLMQRLAASSNDEADAWLGRERGYLSASNAHFELTQTVPARFNRALFYDGTQFHTSHIGQPELLHDDPRQGRLTLNLFLRFQPA